MSRCCRYCEPEGNCRVEKCAVCCGCKRELEEVIAADEEATRRAADYDAAHRLLDEMKADRERDGRPALLTERIIEAISRERDAHENTKQALEEATALIQDAYDDTERYRAELEKLREENTALLMQLAAKDRCAAN